MDVHVIPKAAAKIGLRIPPGQDKDDAIQKLMDYLKTVALWGVEVLPATGGANGQALLTAEHPGQSGAGEAAGEQAGAGAGVGGVGDFVETRGVEGQDEPGA